MYKIYICIYMYLFVYGTYDSIYICKTLLPPFVLFTTKRGRNKDTFPFLGVIMSHIIHFQKEI